MPVTRAAAALYRLLTLTAPRSISGLTTATIDDSAAIARASSSVSTIWRPARSPPAWRLVRPPQTIPMFFPSSRSTLSLPRRKPSPVAESTTTEIMPHRIPNIVRKLRSLFARRFCSDWMMASRITFRLRRSPGRLALRGALSSLACRLWLSRRVPEARRIHGERRGKGSRSTDTRARRSARLSAERSGLRGKDDLIPLLQAVEDLNLRAVADADLDLHLLPAVLRAGREKVDEGVFLRVVGDGGFRDDERVSVFFEHDLGIRGHVRLELLTRVVDRHAHLEVGDVVLLDAHRRDLRDLAVEGLVLERFDPDARRLSKPHTADIGLVHLAAHEDLLDLAKRHDERRVRAQVQDGRDRAADLHVARQHGPVDRRADGRVRDIFGRAVGRGLRLRHLRTRLGDLRPAHGELRLRGALAVVGHVHEAVGIVQRRLRDQFLIKQRPRAIVGAPGELFIRAFGFDDVLLQLRLGAFEGRPRRQKTGFGAA